MLKNYCVFKIIALAAVGSLVGCGPMELPGEQEQAACHGGKCDGFSSNFKDLFSDMKKVDLGDLANQAVKLGIQQINDQLDNIPYSQLEADPTEVYALSNRASGDLTIHDLEDLTAGLTQQYGEQAFVTRINRLRADHLRLHPDKVWGEASFLLGPQLNLSFSHEAGGVTGRIGLLGSKGVKMTVVAPYAGEMQALVHNPADALKAHRHWFLPPSFQQIQQMVPGEALSKQDRGIVGFNVGIGWPVYIATIASYATIHAVIHAGAGVTATGQVDIQLIRDRDNKVVIDVGMKDIEDRHVHLGVDTSWGIEGLPVVKLDVGPVDLDATAFAERAIEKLLNKKLKLLSAQWSNDKSEIRHTIARFSFDLSKRNQCLDQALAQAWNGDIRLAQGLANGQPCNGQTNNGVELLQFLDREATHKRNYLGLSILSMRFFSEKQRSAGGVVITSGNQSQQILFDELEKSSGSFFNSRGYRRRTVYSLTTENGRLSDADYNLHLQITEDDGSLHPWMTMDFVNPMMGFFLGHQRHMQRLVPIGNKIRWLVNTQCSKPVTEESYGWDDDEYPACLKTVASSPEVMTLRDRAKAQLAAMIGEGVQDGMDPSFDDAEAFANALFEVMMAAQSSPKDQGTTSSDVGTTSEGKMLVDIRFSQKAIGSLLTSPNGADRFMSAVKDMVYTLDERGRSSSHPINSYQQDLQRFFEKHLGDQAREGIYELRDKFINFAAKYRRFDTLAGSTWDSRSMGQTSVGNHGHLLVVNSEQDMSLASIAEHKAGVATKMFDKMVDHLDDTVDENRGGSGEIWWLKPHRVIGYSLLGTTYPSEVELLIKMDFDNNKYTEYPENVRLYGRGQQAKIIDAGEYSLDALINR